MSHPEDEKRLGFSTEAVVSIVAITATSAVISLYWTDLSGVQAVTSVGIASLVTAVSATALLYLITRLDPSWSQS